MPEYMSETVAMAERKILRSNEDVVDYWLTKKSPFPALQKADLHILDTTASSGSSERDLRLIEIVLSMHKCYVEADIIEKRLYYSHI